VFNLALLLAYFILQNLVFCVVFLLPLVENQYEAENGCHE
jgi:hypothetical protein